MNQETKEIKAAIVAVASNENLYLRNWVKYHLATGFKKIFIVDNSPEPGGDYPEILLGDYIALGKVHVFTMRKRDKNPDGFQPAVYTACYQELHRDFDWLFFIDTDEFVTFADHTGIKSISEFLGRPEIDSAEQVRINWLCYTDNGLLHYDARPVWERFTTPMYPLNKDDWWGPMPVNATIKSAINCNRVEIADFCVSNSPHYAITDRASNAVCVSPSGRPAKWNKSVSDIEYTTMFLRHYRTLSIEEFLYRRVLSHGMYNAVGAGLGREKLLKMFCVENEMTLEKQKIVDEFFSRLPEHADVESEENKPMEYNPDAFHQLAESMLPVIRGEKRW